MHTSTSLLHHLPWGAGAPRRRVPLLRTATVDDGQVGVVFRHGRQIDVWGPGRHRALTLGVSVQHVDTRTRLTVLPLQEVPTADGVTVRVSLAVLARTTDPVAYATAGPDAEAIAYLAVQVALRELLATLGYDELLAARAGIGLRVHAGVVPGAETGMEVERVEVRDLVLPADLRRAQAAVLLARAEGQAALERARGETAALRSLANAARIAADNPTLLQLRLLQQLEHSSGHTVVLADPSTSRIAAS